MIVSKPKSVSISGATLVSPVLAISRITCVALPRFSGFVEKRFTAVPSALSTDLAVVGINAPAPPSVLDAPVASSRAVLIPFTASPTQKSSGTKMSPIKPTRDKPSPRTSRPGEPFLVKVYLLAVYLF